MHGINVDPDEEARLALCMGCGVGSFPFKYLGLLLMKDMMMKEGWDPLMAKFEKKLAGEEEADDYAGRWRTKRGLDVSKAVNEVQSRGQSPSSQETARWFAKTFSTSIHESFTGNGLRGDRSNGVERGIGEGGVGLGFD
ncbi:hypothetical protein QJS10_CPA06g01056 [Acorus calamus]|uniref:Uncharacterized protein n=1 Tax=Acorus calamus TaxID=4465 RepID=A0AAV9EMV9_ACOCL|nr:hypothetical protein QJS10_CPA06g01056 [Acorus calamus]